MAGNSSRTGSEQTEVIKRTNLITDVGYKKLTEELRQLQKIERPRLVEEVYFAAKQGDRSENAEYLYGKKRLREIDRRIRFLSKRIESARVIVPREQKGSKVLFGATVTVLDEQDRQKKYQIVGEDEIDTLAKRISWKSPIGRGLMNASLGDSVEIEIPSGTVTLQILKIEYF